MEIRKDFAKRVEALAQSTPREAIANIISALMPREPVKTKMPFTAQEIYDEITRDRPDPMAKLQRRSARVRKPLPTGKLAYVVPKNPKKGKSAERFAQYYGMNGATASYLVSVTQLTASDIQWDVDHGFVRFE